MTASEMDVTGHVVLLLHNMTGDQIASLRADLSGQLQQDILDLDLRDPSLTTGFLLNITAGAALGVAEVVIRHLRKRPECSVTIKNGPKTIKFEIRGDEIDDASLQQVLATLLGRDRSASMPKNITK